MIGKGFGRSAGRLSLGLAGAWALALGAGSLQAASFTFTASQGNLAASAEFEVSGTDLIITLTNTSTADVQVPADVLTALFFDVVGSPLDLSRISALLGPTSDVLFGPQPAGDIVGGEWTYETGLVGAPDDQDYGISSSGFGVFSSSGKFPGPNLAGPSSVNGLQYGILSAGDDSTTGNAAVMGGQPLIKNEVVFTLSGVPADFDPETQITSVAFQYGTSLGEPTIRPPEPATLFLMGMGAIALFRHRRAQP